MPSPPYHTGKPAPANMGWRRYTVSRCMVSRRRDGKAIGLIDTPPYIQAEVSRMNIWLGSGGSTNAVGWKLAPTSPSGWNGRSSGMTPPIR